MGKHRWIERSVTPSWPAAAQDAIGADSEKLTIFARERRHLLSVAFRVLGSEPDAEDAVQEAWIKFCRADTRLVRNMPAWLTTVATRLCVEFLRRRREIPHDVIQTLEDSNDEPEEIALLADELTAAFAVVLDELTPPQRVSLVLHDAFGVSFEEIAHILGTTIGSAKKLASRARGRVRERTVTPTDDYGAARQVVDAFLHATREGDTNRLIALLDPNVVRLADSQILPLNAHQRIQGIEAVVTETRAYQATAARGRIALIDDRPGIVIFAGSRVQVALVIRVQRGRIVQFEVIADPQRSAQLHIEEDRGPG
jgi:RNA polymerase sigma factor (sigma-70 family)